MTQNLKLVSSRSRTDCVRELISGELIYNSGTGAFGYIDLEGEVRLFLDL